MCASTGMGIGSVDNKTKCPINIQIKPSPLIEGQKTENEMDI